MKYQWLDEYLMKKKGVEKDFKAEWNWIRYKIADKLFCAVCLDDGGKPYYITLKNEPEDGVILREMYEDIIPGYYMNKHCWSSVKSEGNVPDEVLRSLTDKAYTLVLQSFSKKKQTEILEN